MGFGARKNTLEIGGGLWIGKGSIEECNRGDDQGGNDDDNDDHDRHTLELLYTASTMARVQCDLRSKLSIMCMHHRV